MRRVVVDVSVVVAGLFKDGTVRDVLLNSEDVAFCAPFYLKDEVARHLHEVASRARIPRATAEAILEDLLGAIELIPPGVYSAWTNAARGLTHTAGATGDSDYVALALAIEAPVWTLDKDFTRIPGIRLLATRDVAEL